MKKPIFTGSAVAIVTPFFADGQIDYTAFGKLIDWQIQEGTQAIIVMGTTGENPTISDSEFEVLVDFAVQRVAKRVPVVVGTGRNDTHHSIELSKKAAALGGDALLVTTPYYNKTTQAGLVAHVHAIANSTNLPVILYNVPSRTGMSFTAETYATLSKHPLVNGVKEASGNFTLLLQTFKQCPSDFFVYSGNDDQILPMLALGAKGVISVLANIEPKKTQEMCSAFFNGNLERSAQLQIDYCDLIDAIFAETNPIPIKAALAAMGKCNGTLRLPLVEMSEKGKVQLFEAMKKHDLLK